MSDQAINSTTTTSDELESAIDKLNLELNLQLKLCASQLIEIGDGLRDTEQAAIRVGWELEQIEREHEQLERDKEIVYKAIHSVLARAEKAEMELLMAREDNEMVVEELETIKKQNQTFKKENEEFKNLLKTFHMMAARALE